MPPENTPQPNQSGASQGQLDPSVVALTKAIGKSESGGKYTIGDDTGDGADSYGAYQMTPAFIQEWAPKAGIQYQSGIKLNPQQQDEIAYNAVKTMGTTGDPDHAYLGKLTPAQIASAWSTGDPNAYLDPDYGKNDTYGSTENHVNEVAKIYDAEMGQSASNPLVSTANAATSPDSSESSDSGPSLMDTILGVGGAAGGWLLNNAWKYAQKPLTDAAIDAGAGAVVGSETGPGALATAGIGGLVGLANGIVSDFTDGNNSQSSTPTSDQAAQTSQPAQPDVNAEVAADAGKANPLPPEQNPQPQNQQSNQQSTPQEQQDQEEIQKLEAEMPQANQASQKMAQQIAQDYGTTIPGQRAMDDKNVKEGIQEAGINGWGIPNVVEDENGVKRNDYHESIGKANGAIHETSQNMEQMLDASGATGSMAETIGGCGK